jgi:predicted transcriptional regulator of viral defense system
MMVPYGKTGKNTSKYEYSIEGRPYAVIRVKPELFFGIEKRFINEVGFFVTDLERTLIDGLIRPQYCGGFLEVMHAFKGAQDKINIDKMMGYVLLCGKGSCKRLGWVFEKLGIFKNEQKILKEIPCISSYVIDVSRPSSGEWIRDWCLKKNW